MKTQRQMKLLGKKSRSLWTGFAFLFILMFNMAGIQRANAQSNLLTNPGFETSGAAGWTETITSSIYAYDAAGAGEIHSGTEGRGYWMNSGADAIGSVQQTVNSVAGGTYSASIWTRHETYATAFEYARFKVMNGATQLGSVDLPYGGGYTNTAINNITIPNGASITILVEYKVPGGNAYLTVDDAIFIMTSSGTVATPTFSPAAGTYTSTQSVAISTATSGATIYYTTDGSTPTTSSTVYSSAISVASTKTLKALAVKSGMTNSAVASALYTINAGTVATPTFSPVAGTYTSTQSVAISTSTSGATIYYTTDGSTPTTSSTVYSSAISVASTKTLKALAVKSGMTNSAVASALYTINLPTVATPTFSPVAGTYTSTQSVAISTSTSGATIYYTTDGSTPTTSSTVYSSAISVASTETLKALAVKSGMTNSAVASALYTITIPTVATPTFSPAAGTYSSAQSVTISTSTSGATIYYTTDGSTPTTSSTVYSSAISVASSKTIKALAVKSGMTNSSVASAAYTIGAAIGQPGVTLQFWAGITGANVSDLTGNANFPNNPTSTSILSSFEAPSSVGVSYGQRVSGYLTAPVSGTYKFWIASDDNSELWLSTNGLASNKVKIASVTGWTNPEEWSKYASQASAGISLVAGTQYYIEALMKQDQGGDNLSVAWQIPGGSQVVIPSSALSTALTVPIPAPGSFTQSAPANGATGVSVTPTFTWGSSSDAVSYALVVSTSSSYASPVINVSGLSSTSYTPATGLAGNTQYYWKVTATNTTASTVSTNAGISFTTLIPPAPGSFTQTAPGSGATGIGTYPTFTWGSSSNAASYSLVVSTSSSYSSPVINVSGLTSATYTAGSPLSTSTVYFWKVTATNGTGSTTASNAGISFTTGATSGTTYYVSTSGVDAPGNGTSGSPWRTLAYAASQVTAGTGNKTISIGAGTFVETACTILPLGVNIVGAGEGNTILTANGALPTPGVDQSAADYHLWADGSLIQLKSPIYSGANPRYGDPSLMIAAQDGNQTLSGFTIDGHSKTVKVGIWVENRNNVTVHHVTFNNLNQSGAVFSRGDMIYYVVLPDGKWMNNTTVHDLTFSNSGSVSGGEQVGNLCLGGLDGADIYNIHITDPNGEGIKFEHVGHFRNTKIHDCTISVGETDPSWGEKISMELWNLSYNNEVYNITCNTWFSMVNHYQLDAYQPTAQHPSNLKIHNITMIDGDGVSGGIESIECALSGVEIYDSYFQDKGFGIAIWGGAGWGGDIANHNDIVRNNIFARVNIPATFSFGNTSAVFIPDPANNIQIYNNVFDNLGNSLQLDNGTGVDIKNNIFLNSQGDDIQGGSSLTIQNNLRFNSDPQRQTWKVSGSLGTGNIIGDPGLLKTGSRTTTYYQPASASSLVVDKGIPVTVITTGVQIPYNGSNPDIGRWEFGGGGGRIATPEETISTNSLSVYPNPTAGTIKITAGQDLKMHAITILNMQGQTLLNLVPGDFSSVSLDLSSFTNDFYIVKVKHENGIITKKIVLMK